MYMPNIHFPTAEEEVMKFWKENDSFLEGQRLARERKKYVFYDGPPFATGLPHYGHILSGTVKDIVGRFAYQQGYSVERRFGWDCHGLPVEYEIDKKLGLAKRQEIEEMGIDKYNGECRSIVMKYSGEWRKTVERMGRWVNIDNDYKTMDIGFMETTWRVFKELYDRNKVYRGYRVMPFSTACKTPLSNFEANQNYKEVSDPSVLVAFKLKTQVCGRDVELVAWTTTPWTLPSNCLLLVNKNYRYGVYKLKDRYIIVHENRADEYFKEKKFVGSIMGNELEGMEYEALFSYYEDKRKDGYFRVRCADFVSDVNGTAVVHCAPAFGEDDYNACVECGILQENGEAPCPVDENGCFTLEPYKGVYIKDLDMQIVKNIKDRILMNGRIVHSYPFCWRSDTLLIYKLVPHWFIKVKESCKDLLKNNEKIRWVPEDIKYKRFHNWLEQCRDWAVGRNRFWGTPIPIWVSSDFSDYICVGSIEELEKLSGQKVGDLHREYVDKILIKRKGKEYRRVEEVLDCWFESGSMPYAQSHWMFEGSDFNPPADFPADFIGEGIDQTRGWFYTLHVLSTLLFDQPAFKNVLVFGTVLAEDGRKMSKRLKNYPDPKVIFDNYGADSLRLYLLSSPVVASENLRFSEAGVSGITKSILIPWYNSLAFYCDSSSSHYGTETSMDKWIFSSLNNLNLTLSSAASNLRLNLIVPSVSHFIDDLTNWYIRINRTRLRVDNSLLASILLDFSILMSPFVPFFSEYSYQTIISRLPDKDSRPSSVHHCMYPSATASYSHPFANAKAVIESIRQIREKLRIRLKRPLRSLKVVASKEHLGILRNFDALIRDECNIISLEYDTETHYNFNLVARPYFDAIRRNTSDKALLKKKLQSVSSLTEKQIHELSMGNAVVIDEDLSILSEEVLLDKKFVGVDCGDIVSQAFSSFGVIVDTGSDEHIENLATAREFFAFVQKMRKNAGLKCSDVVAVEVKSEDLKRIVTSVYQDFVFGTAGAVVSEATFLYDKSNLKVVLHKE